MASSILGALFYYFDKCLYQDNEWEDFIDVGVVERTHLLRTAYKQYLFKQVTRAVRNSAHDYTEYMKPLE